MNLVVEADGGSRGNPGPAGYGAVVKDADGQVLAEAADALGITTNNVAEYQGLIAGLRSALELAGDGATVEVRMDSKLVIEQMAGRWKIKNEGLRPLATEARDLARRLRVTWKWIPRERNRDADRLANEAMDAAARGTTWQGGTSPPASPRTTSGPPPGASALPSGEPGSIGDGTSAGQARVVAEKPRAASASGWTAASAATSFLLLRHGETPFSIDRRFSGTGDPELTATGLAQADAAAARLSRAPYAIDVIVSSPLRRARQTAEAVAARTGLKVAVEDGLREVDFGAWEGHTFTEIQRAWPDELAAWLADPSVTPPGGESFDQAAVRVQQARDRLLLDHQGKTVLVVSHVSPIKLLLSSALLAPLAALYRMHLDLAALSVIDYFPDGPQLVRTFNDTAHLR
ncbi:bifunctional RNase H/acid phosphatase [Sphaerisporangium album]|uniref:Bifunctional RNase H/acid phosphatase n=1 Tax=Sphaerisporangium album TaxID=509200 RepID=A0A367FLL5_9ACTN|nr:bifunctional RNase H/acid phosphatase [Sphaerisporangium album]RCG30607.1 bifunctional RNase H/acid phosphatase [Sphaerisporangium album]